MKSIKYSINNIERHIIKNIFISLQIIASFILLFYIIGLFLLVKGDIVGNFKISEKVYTATCEESSNYMHINEEKLKKIYNFYDEQAVFHPKEIQLETFNGITRFEKNNYPNRLKEKDFKAISFLDVTSRSKGFIFKNFNGQWFESEDFSLENKDATPAILGYDYKKYLSIGDTLEFLSATGEIKTLKVKGFLDRGSYAIVPNDLFYNTNLDKLILTPILNYNDFKFLQLKNLPNYSEFIGLYLDNLASNSYFISENQSENLIKEKLYDSTESSFAINSVKSEIYGVQEEKGKVLVKNLIIFFIVFIYTIARFRALLTTSINERRTEFNKQYLDSKAIYKIIAYHVLIIISFSYVISLAIISKLFGNNSLIRINLLNLSIFTTLIIGIGIIIIGSLIFKLRNSNISSSNGTVE